MRNMAKQDGDKDAQFRRFVETARGLEADEDKDRFEAKLKRIAQATPPSKSGDAKPNRRSAKR